MISRSAQDKLVEMEALDMKAAFADAQVFEGLLSQSAAAAEKPYVAPGHLAERVNVSLWTAQDGTPCYTLYPKDVSEGDAWASSRHLLYFHGGGLVMQVGPPHWEFCLLLVEHLGCTVTMPVYPLLPVYTWQDAHASVVASYRGLLQKSGVDPSRLALAGDSAGGLLAITLMQLCKLYELPDPGAVISFSPMTDLGGEVPMDKKVALEPDDPLIGFQGLGRVPELWVPDSADREQFPPCVLQGPMADLPQQWVFAGSRECLLPEMAEYVRRVEEAASPIVFDVREEMWHTYMLMPEIDEGREAFERVLLILRDLWDEGLEG